MPSTEDEIVMSEQPKNANLTPTADAGNHRFFRVFSVFRG